jgi:hypothetical protein
MMTALRKSLLSTFASTLIGKRDMCGLPCTVHDALFSGLIVLPLESVNLWIESIQSPIPSVQIGV